MARRLLNLVMKERKYGKIPWPPPVYSLRRIDPNEYLFYPSTLEAHAAAKDMKNVVGSPKGSPAPPPWMESLSQLPEPEAGFRMSSSSADDERLAFLPLYGRDSSGADASKILCVDQAGHAVLYDADAGCFEVVPSFNSRQMCRVGSHRICYLLPRTGGAAAARSDTRSGEALYVLEDSRCPNFGNFESFVYSDPASEYSNDRHLDRTNGKKGWRWNRLPLPSRVCTDIFSIISSRHANVSCHTLADIGGNTAICISIADPSGRGGIAGTHCFNTGTQKWTKAGDWMLPFRGRAVHIPELGGLWFGVGHEHPDHLCAMDLSSSFHGEDTPAAPKLLYKWSFPTLPKEWSMLGCNLVYLGDGKFCITKHFEFSKDCDVLHGTKKMTVMSGVEVMRAGPTSSRFRMVKHRSRFYEFAGDWYTREFIEFVL